MCLFTGPCFITIKCTDIYYKVCFGHFKQENCNECTGHWILALPYSSSLYHTQDGQHHAIFEHLHGSGTDKEDSLECIALSEEVLSRSTEWSFDVQRQGAQAATTGRGKQRQLQDLLVKVHGDVGPQLVREVLQQLWRWWEGERQRRRRGERNRGGRHEWGEHDSCENTSCCNSVIKFPASVATDLIPKFVL